MSTLRLKPELRARLQSKPVAPPLRVVHVTALRHREALRLTALVPGAADPRMPFAIGIRQVILALPRAGEISDTKIRRALGRLCRSSAYLHALARAGSKRHDIAGNPVADVSDADRAEARAQLAKRT